MSTSSFYDESINLMFKYKGSFIFIIIIIISKNKYFHIIFIFYFSKHIILYIKEKIF